MSPADAITDGSELGTVRVGLNGVQVALRHRRAIAAIVVATVVFVISVFLRSIASRGDALYFGAGVAVVVSFLVLAVVPSFLLTLAPAAYYADRLGIALGARRVLATPDGLGVRETIRRLMRSPQTDAAGSRPTCYVAVEDDRLSLWSRRGTALLPLLVVPRSRITEITATSLASGYGQPSSGVSIGIRRDDGRVLTLAMGIHTFRLAGPKRMAAAQRESVDWLLNWVGSRGE